MVGANDLARMVPGFDFLQGLLKNAGSSLPNIGQWVAPTLDPEELDKRISELRTVQFWLEQNAKLLATTIQALEVQRMTLSTLQSMNLPLADLGEALKIKMPPPPPAPAPRPPAPAPAARAEPEEEPEDDAEDDTEEAEPDPAPRRKTKGPASATPAPAAVDPMQWWGALTQQFTELAAKAVKDSSADSAKAMAGAAVKQALDKAAKAGKTAAKTAGKKVATPTKTARRAAPRKRGA